MQSHRPAGNTIFILVARVFMQLRGCNEIAPRNNRKMARCRGVVLRPRGTEVGRRGGRERERGLKKKKNDVDYFALLTSRGMRVCFRRRIFALHMTHLNGKSLCETAICIVLTKQRLQND